MARRGTVRVTGDLEGDDTQHGDTVDGTLLSPAEADAAKLDQEEADDVLRMLSALDAGGNDVLWQIRRVTPEVINGEHYPPGFLFEIPTAQLTLSYIKQRCGYGKFRATGFRTDGKYAGQRTFTITKELPQPGTSLVPVPKEQDLFKNYLETIERSKLQSKEELKFWAALLIPIFGPLVARMLFDRPQSNIAELVTALKGLKGLSDEGGAMGQIKGAKDLIELAKELAPDKETTGSTWPDIIRDGLKEVAPLLTTLATRARGAAPGAAAPGANPNAPAGAAADIHAPNPDAGQTAAGDPMFALLNWFRQWLPRLTQWAAQNRDPVTYAEVFADEVPPNIPPQQLYAILSREDWWSQLASLYPPAQPYQGWFTALRNELLSMLTEVQPEVPDDGQPNTN
jgi:hypothetical protein